MKKVCVVGLGYVGLPLAINISKKFTTYGFDTNRSKIKSLKKGYADFNHINKKNFKSSINSSFFPVSTLNNINPDVYIICVPTPLDNKNKPDLKPLISAVDSIAIHLKKGDLIINESTSYPGTLRNLIIPRVYKTRPDLKNSILFASAPERLSPSNIPQKLHNIPRVLAGIDNHSLVATLEIYKKIIDSIHVASTPEIAEAVKILENTFRLVNISFINEFSSIMNHLKIDTSEVIKLAATKPYGFAAFYPTVFAGGHCIPVDPVYLYDLVYKNKLNSPILKQSILTNQEHPKKVAKYIKSNLKHIKRPKIAIIGVSYKEFVKDTRESAAEKLYDELKNKNYIINFFDDYVEHWKNLKKIDESWRGDSIIILLKPQKLKLSLVKKNNPNLILHDFTRGFIIS